MKQGHVNDFKPEIRSLLRRLIAAGCAITQVSNGEELFPSKGVPADARRLTECDEGTISLRTPAGALRSLYLVLGNEPGVIVADYTVDPLLDAVTEAHFQEWDGKAQPTKPCPYAAERAKFNAEARASAERNRRANWALLRLEGGGNRVMCEYANTTKAAAVEYFSAFIRVKLDADGYHRCEEHAPGQHVSYCVAEGL